MFLNPGRWNLSAALKQENLRASVSASLQESDKGGKLAQQNGESGSLFGFQAVYSKQPLRKMLCLEQMLHSTGLAILRLFFPKLGKEGKENIMYVSASSHRQHMNI